MNTDSTFTYVNNTDIRTKDSITYRLCNSLGVCSDAKVFFNIINDGCVNGQYKPNDTGNPVNVVFNNTTTTVDAMISAYKKDYNYGIH